MRASLTFLAALAAFASLAAEPVDPMPPFGETPPAAEPPADAPPAPPPVPAVTPGADGYPFEAEVNADRVHLRAAGDRNERVLSVASRGNRVTVLEERYGWYRIACPQGCKGWIHAKHASEAKGLDGAPSQVTLTGDRIVMRATDNPKAAPMGTFPKGAAFTVVRRHGDWYEVQATPEASCWIFHEYVTPLNGYTPPKVTEPPPGPVERVEDPKPPKPAPEDEAMKREWAALEAERERLMQKPLAEMEPDQLIAKYGDLAARAGGVLAQRCDARAKELSERRTVRDEIRNGIADVQQDLQRRLDEIEQRYQLRVEQILKEHRAPPKASDFAETGWVAGVGRMIGCPASYRLNKGGRHLCFLKSPKGDDGKEKLDLARYRNSYVGVNGERVHDSRWGEMILVRDIQVLDDASRP